MQVLLSQEDFVSLSDSTKNELMTILGINLDPKLLSPGLSIENGAVENKPTSLEMKLVKSFMSGVSVKTKNVLRLFAEADGETTINEISVHIEKFHWAGFQSGVTRRLRRMTDDESAQLFGWPDDYGDDWNNTKIWISPATCESLKKYFSI